MNPTSDSRVFSSVKRLLALLETIADCHIGKSLNGPNRLSSFLDLYHRNIISHVCKCIHFTARVRITYAVMNQEMRADTAMSADSTIEGRL